MRVNIKVYYFCIFSQNLTSFISPFNFYIITHCNYNAKSSNDFKKLQCFPVTIQRYSSMTGVSRSCNNRNSFVPYAYRHIVKSTDNKKITLKNHWLFYLTQATLYTVHASNWQNNYLLRHFKNPLTFGKWKRQVGFRGTLWFTSMQTKVL